MALDFDFACDQFETYWRDGEYEKAISIYHTMGRPFWWTEEIANYYLRMGMVNAAMEEFEYLVTEYLNISPDFLPLPQGPRELFLLGKWYMDKDATKAKKFLCLYTAAAEVWKTDPALHLPHKAEAKRLLAKLAR